MKVLSLLQPWASLVLLGHKKIETRSWNTKYRGQILIHASLKKPSIEIHHALQGRTIPLNVPAYGQLPYGAIIGMVELVGTTEFTVFSKEPNDIIRCQKKEWHTTEQELAFGDYTPGRYGWLLDNPILFKNPIPAKGNLGLWNYKSCECTHTQACSTCAEIKDIDWSIIEPAFKK